MYQIRFGKHRKTYFNRIWYNVCTIFGRKLYHIRSEYGTFVPYSTEYGTFVPYSFLYQIRSNKATLTVANPTLHAKKVTQLTTSKATVNYGLLRSKYF